MIDGVGADGTVTIARRYTGPPASGNGGWACGTLAGDGPAEVTLRRPVPLETPLRIGRAAGGAATLSGSDGEVVLEAVALEAGDAAALRSIADAAPAVTLDAARAAGAATPLADGHPFPTCFGCGPEHPDGLHCLAGPVGDDGAWAVTFTPESDDARLAWAALDCPTAAPHLTGVPMVLGRMAAEVLEPLEAGAEHAVVAWATGAEGRRRFSCSAILDGDGSVRAVARAVWVTLKAP